MKKAVRGCTALQSTSVRNSMERLFGFAKLLECARVLASLFRAITLLGEYDRQARVYQFLTHLV